MSEEVNKVPNDQEQWVRVPRPHVSLYNYYTLEAFIMAGGEVACKLKDFDATVLHNKEVHARLVAATENGT